MPPRPLEIPGYGATPLPCVLHGTGDERGIAVVFPGAGSAGNRLGGTPARPDLHYTRAVLEAERLAVLEVWWDAGSAAESDRDDWLDANVAAALATASEEFELALLVGRSLGTWALARALSASTPPIDGVPTVWLAPLLDLPVVKAALRELDAPAFVVGGSSDEAFNVAEAEALRDRGVEVVIVDGANHGLEVHDPPTSARLLADTLERLRDFVARTTATAN
jgi:pimeloyl-ACP methyl ester carboxylesterase